MITADRQLIIFSRQRYYENDLNFMHDILSLHRDWVFVCCNEGRDDLQ